MYLASPRDFSNTVSRCRRRVVLHHLRLDLPIVMHSAMSGSRTLLSPFTNSFYFLALEGLHRLLIKSSGGGGFEQPRKLDKSAE